ncbi:DNA-binding transcriptional regulator, MarR family [Paramicrobacterium humi]|uniref:DNA-binding transcriptional regulator, MarR family n=1 Tax=Paramicrobacterium humi TaxID=640635 RepID=A0A1H4KJB0_9MICO|nr:MarR family transcriptional regulator [Microbacterium humi]SEB58649.1 DNA-binding transcriptional regulator, MarR family [Microbacterium humi]
MTEPRWLTAEQLEAWKRLVAVVELLPGILDSQLQRDADLTHFEYYTLAMLSESEGRTLRMTALAAQTNATLPRLSHVVSRLEKRGLIERMPCPEDRRATNVRLTEAGWEKLVETAPGHVATVQDAVIGALDERDVSDLARIAERVLSRIDPDSVFGITGHRGPR